jgi:hypothetical protein
MGEQSGLRQHQRENHPVIRGHFHAAAMASCFVKRNGIIG